MYEQACIYPTPEQLRSGQTVRLRNGKKVQLIIKDEDGWLTNGNYPSKDCPEWLNFHKNTYAHTFISFDEVESILDSIPGNATNAKQEYIELVSSYADRAKDLLFQLTGNTPNYPTLEDNGDLNDEIADAIGSLLWAKSSIEMGWPDIDAEVLEYLAEKEQWAKREAEAENESWKSTMASLNDPRRFIAA
jgi:hypothetical protein